MGTIRILALSTLVLAVFAYGAAASVDVFLPAFFLPEEAEEHSHESPSSYCGFVYQPPEYLCVQAMPVLDTCKAPVIQRTDSVESVSSAIPELHLASVFNFYRFRAPPQA